MYVINFQVAPPIDNRRQTYRSFRDNNHLFNLTLTCDPFCSCTFSNVTDEIEREREREGKRDRKKIAEGL